jgi:hypothetical protein
MAIDDASYGLIRPSTEAVRERMGGDRDVTHPDRRGSRSCPGRVLQNHLVSGVAAPDAFDSLVDLVERESLGHRFDAMACREVEHRCDIGRSPGR